MWVHVGDDGVAVADLAEVARRGAARARPGRRLVGHRPAGRRPRPPRPRRGPAVRRRQPRPRPRSGPRPASAPPPTSAPLADLVRECAHREGWRAITVDARVLHDAGATDVDALAVAVATGVEYLRHLEAEPASRAEDAFGQLELRVGGHRRPVPHRRRAAGRCAGCGRGSARRAACPRTRRGARTHAVTSLRMFSREDPWVNVLRSTLAAFGASVGGADAMTVLPYDTVLGLPERLRAAAGAQHPDPPRRRVQRRAGHRPRWRLLVPRVAHRRGGGCRVVPFPGGRAGRWRRARPRRRDAARLGRPTRPPSATASSATRRRPLTGVSMFPAVGDQPVRSAAHDATVPGAEACPGTATRRDGLRGAARPGRGPGRPAASSCAPSGPAVTSAPARRS